MLRFSIFLLCSTVLNMSTAFSETVMTKSGAIRGKQKFTMWYNKPYYSYRGIQYAEHPIGRLRFKAPEPVKPWTGVKEAYEYGIWCSQKSNKPTSESCLTLNIFVPILQQKRKLPVLFFISGGSFATGSGSDFIYGPDFMVENEVILVTLNFRLAIFGFLSLGTPEYSGNMGLKDQQLALKWIYDNIESFGGDNKKITLGGVSVGGNSAGFHLTNKESSKYFNQILSLSGAANKYHNYHKGDHRCIMKELYKKRNGRYPSSDEQLIDFLKDANTTDIINFFQETYIRKYSVWTPVIEKPNSIRPIITDEPLTALKNTKGINKTAYYTITKYEYLSIFEIGQTDYLSPESVRKFINNFNIDLPIYGYKSIIDKRPAYLESLREQLRNYYFNKSTCDDSELLLQRAVLDSDLYYAYSMEKWIEQHVAISQKNTYFHRFSLRTILNPHPEFPSKYTQIAGHAEDLPYAFTTTLYFYDAKKVIENKETDDEHAKAYRAMIWIQKLFTNFVKYGKPIHSNTDIPMKGEFKPIKPSSKAEHFDFVDVTTDGLTACTGLTEGRTKFLDQIIKNVIKLVEKNKDVPTKTQIEQVYDMIFGKSAGASSSK